MSAARKPFENDADFLDTMWELFATRSRRLAATKERRDAEQDVAQEFRRGRGGGRVGDGDDVVDRFAALTAREERQQAQLDARLAAHRADPSAQPLGLDRLAEAHDLNEDERTVLLAAYCVALSEDLASYCFDALGTGFAGLGSPEFVMRLTGATSTADRVRARSLFLETGKLVRSGLVTVDYRRNDDPQPEDLLWSRVRITQSAFDAVSGISGPVLTLVEARA